MLDIVDSVPACAADTFCAAGSGAVPGDLGNTLRLARSANDIAFSWGADPVAATYNLHRSETASAWPPDPWRAGLAGTSVLVEDEAAVGPPAVYYRVKGVSCAGVEGP